MSENVLLSCTKISTLIPKIMNYKFGVGVGGELEQSVPAPVEPRLVLGPGLSSWLAIMWARICSSGRKAAISGPGEVTWSRLLLLLLFIYLRCPQLLWCEVLSV